jgi:hypothetical protein
MNPNFSAKTSAGAVDAVPQVYSVQEVHSLKQNGVAPQKGARDIAFASERLLSSNNLFRSDRRRPRAQSCSCSTSLASSA